MDAENDDVLARPRRVLVVADQLVAEAVGVALLEQGLPTISRTWPTRPRTEERGDLTLPATDGAEVGLLISDLDTEARVETARSLVATTSLRWAVLTGAPRGALWGAVLSAGAQVMIPNNSGLADVVRTLLDLPGLQVPPEEERPALVAAWEDLWSTRRAIAERVASLSPREHQVLRMLYRGERVGSIASSLEVSDATVRTQVKALLRKLDVGSQIAAVAVYGAVRAPEMRTPVPATVKGPVDVPGSGTASTIRARDL